MDYSALKKLHGECIKRVEGYWEYELCIGKQMLQYHGTENYVLGYFSKEYKDVQEYTEGTECNPQNRIKRSAQVVYMCGRNVIKHIFY